MSAASSSDCNRRQALATSVERCFLIAMSTPQCDHYRLVLAPSSTRRILAEQSQRRLRLPRISILRWTRAAEQVQAVIEAQWGLKVVVIDFLGDSSGHDRIVIAELRDGHALSSLPHACSWVRLSDIPEDETSSIERSTIGKLLNDGATGRGGRTAKVHKARKDTSKDTSRVASTAKPDAAAPTAAPTVEATSAKPTEPAQPAQPADTPAK